MKTGGIIAALAMVLMVESCEGVRNGIEVSNSTDRDRREVVTVSLTSKEAGKFAGKAVTIKDAAGKQVDYQVTQDRALIFVADVKARSKATYRIVGEKPEEMKTLATGKVYANRLDDIAWENDKIAFRAYGPALQARGEKAYGYDIWVKNTEEPVVDARYAKHLDPATNNTIDSLRRTGNPEDRRAANRLRDETSYHNDHGDGLDCYSVGPTLGGGASALMLGDSILYPYCYQTYEILENGPLRFRVRLTYEPKHIGEMRVTEVRTITLDAESRLNHTVVEYKGVKEGTEVVAGPVVHHSDGGEYFADVEKCVVGYEDPTDRRNGESGKIYVGAVFVQKLSDARLVLFGEAEAKERGAFGHVLGMREMFEGESLDYYWGAAWSEAGMDSIGEWRKYLEEYAANLKEPMKAKMVSISNEQ
ncbi:MAG: DUF4861 family protein [Bacteroidales bacterium]|nr:DUF4861 family protein [Bacteroidales bacterium]